MLASFMLLGVGYAAWSKTLTVNNTVTTAKFDVAFLDNGDLLCSPNTNATGTIVPGSEGHRLQIDINNFYPGANAGVRKIIKNNSSIPVEINSAILGVVSDSANKIDAKRILTHDITITNHNDHSSNGSTVQYLVSNTARGLNTKLQEHPINLPSGESCVFTYTVTWDDQGDAYEEYKNQTLSFTYDLGYTQATN